MKLDDPTNPRAVATISLTSTGKGSSETQMGIIIVGGSTLYWSELFGSSVVSVLSNATSPTSYPFTKA